MRYEDALAYIADFWPRIIRSNPSDKETLIGLPRPYLVPADGGGTGMFQEMYYWDSFFMSLGVVGTPHEHLIEDIAENFAHLIERFGLIPNGSRYYFTSRSQPPFFTQQIKLALKVKQARGDADTLAWLTRMAALAEREHDAVWMGDRQPHHRQVHRGLSRYFDINYLDILASCESGWDHSTRCDERWLSHLPVDLNSILYLVEHDLADFAEQLNKPDRAAHWRATAEQRAATMRELMWDEREGFFFDYNWREGRVNPHPSLAGFYPLWAGLATQDQAEESVERWLLKFLQPGGLVTTLHAAAGKQWAWPNGWAPLQWIVTEGLDRYGFADEAREARTRWCETCAAVFERTGAFWEKYDVIAPNAAHTEDGLYGMVKGFGWSNGVFADFARKLDK
jgi:alpha,alpha-trehalase